MLQPAEENARKRGRHAPNLAEITSIMYAYNLWSKAGHTWSNLAIRQGRNYFSMVIFPTKTVCVGNVKFLLMQIRRWDIGGD